MLGVFIYELVYNAQQQGTPISLKVRSTQVDPQSNRLIAL